MIKIQNGVCIVFKRWENESVKRDPFLILRIVIDWICAHQLVKPGWKNIVQAV